MSYRLAAYAIDIDRLKAVFGSKNEKLVSMIKSCRERDFEKHDEWFTAEIESGCPTIGDALEQIVMGVITGSKEAGFQYAYATEALCQYMGMKFRTENIGFISRLGMSTGLTGSGLPFPVPEPDDFPEVGYLTAAQVVEEYPRHVAAEAERPWDEDSDAREELISMMEQVQEWNEGIVTFTY